MTAAEVLQRQEMLMRLLPQFCPHNPTGRMHTELIERLAALRSENADSAVAWQLLTDAIVELGKSDVDTRAGRESAERHVAQVLG